MGRVLADRGKKTLLVQMQRDFLQMIGNAFPVYEVIVRNSGGSVSSQCLLCHKEDK